jgi:phosphatidylinositol glycan class W
MASHDCFYFDHATGVCYNNTDTAIIEHESHDYTTTTNNTNTLSLKLQKEAFVTGHSGGTPLEILVICLMAPIGILFCLELQQHCGTAVLQSNARAVIAVEALVLLFPMMLCQTDLFWPYGCIVALVELVAALGLRHRRRSVSRSRRVSHVPVDGAVHGSTIRTISTITQQQQTVTTKMLDFLTAYRSTVLVMTIIAILAVDFHIFPRRHAKTETSGYGLMDIGAASFVISAGFVSSYARSAYEDKANMSMSSSGAGEDDDNTSSMTASYVLAFTWKAMQRSLPILSLGAIRLVATKGVDYQEHVSEYGVHWNFFLSLAVVAQLSVCLRLLQRAVGKAVKKYKMVAILLSKQQIIDLVFLLAPWIYMMIYQRLLSKWGLQSMVENAERSYRHSSSIDFFAVFDETSLCGQMLGVTLQFLCDMFYANREGLLGSLSYLCLHCMSEDIAKFCIWAPSKEPTQSTGTCPSTNGNGNLSSPKREMPSGGRILAVCVGLWKIHLILVNVFEVEVSRRSMNLTFVTWSLAHNMTILYLCWLAFYLGADDALPLVDWGNNNNKHAQRNRREVEVSVTGRPTNMLIFRAMNHHGLLIFLVANLLTGIVNLSINTLSSTKAEALFILALYLSCVAATALLLETKVIRDARTALFRQH